MNVIEILEQKPLFGAAAGFAGTGAAVLAWLKVISIVFGAAGAVLGAVAAAYTIYNQVQIKRDRQQKTPPA